MIKKIQRHPLFQFLSSLKLAVISLLTLSAILAAGTIVESLYGRKAVKLLVYSTPWFYASLFLLGTSVTCAVISRIPLKIHQTGFAVTHLGIILLLVGSVITQITGVDGQLAVTEGKNNQTVFTNELALYLYDEQSGQTEMLPIKETGLRSTQNSLTVHFDKGSQLALTEFLPRTREHYKIKEGQGFGRAYLKGTLFNSRFNQEITLEEKKLDWNEQQIGPALFRFKTASSDKEVQQFVNSKNPLKETQKADPYGTLIVYLKDNQHTIQVKNYLNSFKRIPASTLSLKVKEYWNHAVVKNDKLVNKTKELVNPAIEIIVRGQGFEEGHTIFSQFPDFPTFHQAASKGKEPLGFKFRYQVEALEKKGASLGQMDILYSPFEKKLHFKTYGQKKTLKESGILTLNKPQSPGWMDLQFEVTEWYPKSTKRLIPEYIHRIENSDPYLAAVKLSLQTPLVAGDKNILEDFWLMQGSTQELTINQRRVFVTLSKSKFDLPFDIHLRKFHLKTNPGTTKARAYESDILLHHDEKNIKFDRKISMNDPLDYGGYTFFQSSYKKEKGEPDISIFAVNKDPGLWVKYLGSIVLVLGMLIMFYMNPHYLGIIFGKRKTTS